MSSIGTARVADVMVTKIVTVKETDKMEQVASVFKENDINAAPVLGRQGKCVGIITSHDLVEYESERRGVFKEFSSGKHGAQIFSTSQQFRMPGTRYDEAGFHMSTSLQTASVDDPLSRVARNMCSKHIHHVVVLDENKRPVGFLSSLDILGFVVGEPVCRTATCGVETPEDETDDPNSISEVLLEHADFESDI